MPQSAYRTQVGIAKDAANATLTQSAASGQAVIHVSNSNILASSTVFIIDGQNSEQFTVSSGGGSTTVTLSGNLVNTHPAGVYVASQLTASVGPADSAPLTVIEPEDTIQPLEDKGMRGSAVETYDVRQGMRWANVTFGGDCFTDTFPYFVAGVTGGVDFSGGTPNTFNFSTLNTGKTQPTPFLVWLAQPIDSRMFARLKVEEVALKWDPSQLLSFTSKCQGFTSGPVGAQTFSYSATTPSTGYLTVASIGGSAVAYVLQADITMKRPVNPVLTLNGIQDPYEFWNAQQTAEGKMTIVMEDNVQLNNFLNNSQPSLDLTWTNTGANPTVLEFHATKAAFITGKPKYTGSRGGYIELDISFKCLANTTDATTAGAGYAPFKFTVKNSKSTGTYQ